MGIYAPCRNSYLRTAHIIDDVRRHNFFQRTLIKNPATLSGMRNEQGYHFLTGSIAISDVQTPVRVGSGQKPTPCHPPTPPSSVFDDIAAPCSVVAASPSARGQTFHFHHDTASSSCPASRHRHLADLDRTGGRRVDGVDVGVDHVDANARAAGHHAVAHLRAQHLGAQQHATKSTKKTRAHCDLSESLLK